MKTNKKISEIVAKLIATIIMTPNGQFMGLKEYVNNNGEVANHVVQVNFNYGKAKENDIKKLENISDEDINTIVIKLNEKNFSDVTFDEVKEIAENLLFSMKNPKEKTEKQENTYLNIEGTSLKIHIETEMVHAYSLAVQKNILVEGEYKETQSKRQTVIQNTIKKHLSFTLLKFKQFKFSPDKVSKVSVAGKGFEF